MFELRLIKTENDYKSASKRLDELADMKVLSKAESNELELLAHLIEEYEEIQFPIALPSPIAAIQFRMDQLNLKPVDLVPLIGSRSKVSEILSGKRQLSIGNIRSLHTGLQIPLEALVRPDMEYSVNQIDDIDWDRFPVKAMFDYGKNDYFPNIKASYKQIKANVDYYFRCLFDPVKNTALEGGLLRQKVRMGSSSDKYALAAWIAACNYKANQETLQTSFDPDKVEIITNQLRSLSVLDEGPIQAINFLKKVGLHVVILRHLPKTHLDGAAFFSSEGSPVIALTLRYDRIDHFWFSLFHELGHVYYHLFNGNAQKFYMDDLQLIAADEIEMEADTFASESLVSDKELQESGLFDNHTSEKVVTFARQKYIHPAIVAGRLRHHFNNFYILSNLVGNGQIRKLFF